MHAAGERVYKKSWSFFVAMPVLQSLLLADHVYRDQATGKHVICGVFSTIFFNPNPPPENVAAKPTDNIGTGGNENAAGNGSEGSSAGQSIDSRPGIGRADSSQPPQRTQPIQNLMQAGSPYLYFSVTELKDRKTFEVRYVDLHDNRSLFQTEVPIECDDPLKTIEVSLPLPRLPLTALEERVYALEIVCDGQLLGSHRVLARITPGFNPQVT